MFKKYYNGIVEHLKDDFGYNSENDRLNFKDTPKRADKALREMILPKDQVLANCLNHLSKTFKTEAEDMVVVGPIDVISVCPHHLIPISMKVIVGYIPRNQVLGLSKLVRVSETFGKQPILQEEYAKELCTLIDEVLLCNGVGVYTNATHGCMLCRGVRSQAKTIVTSLKGWLLDDGESKEEFLGYVRDLLND